MSTSSDFPHRLEKSSLGVGEARGSSVCVCVCVCVCVRVHTKLLQLHLSGKKFLRNSLLPPATYSESRRVWKVGGSPKQRGSEIAEFLAHCDCVHLCGLDAVSPVRVGLGGRQGHLCEILASGTGKRAGEEGTQNGAGEAGEVNLKQPCKLSKALPAQCRLCLPCVLQAAGANE